MPSFFVTCGKSRIKVSVALKCPDLPQLTCFSRIWLGYTTAVLSVDLFRWSSQPLGYTLASFQDLTRVRRLQYIIRTTTNARRPWERGVTCGFHIEAISLHWISLTFTHSVLLVSFPDSWEWDYNTTWYPFVRIGPFYTTPFHDQDKNWNGANTSLGTPATLIHIYINDFWHSHFRINSQQNVFSCSTLYPFYLPCVQTVKQVLSL